MIAFTALLVSISAEFALVDALSVVAVVLDTLDQVVVNALLVSALDELDIFSLLFVVSVRVVGVSVLLVVGLVEVI